MITNNDTKTSLFVVDTKRDQIQVFVFREYFTQTKPLKDKCSRHKTSNDHWK